MVSIANTIGIYIEHYKTILKWYSLASKGKPMTKLDDETYNLFTVIYRDLERENYEEEESNDN